MKSLSTAFLFDLKKSTIDTKFFIERSENKWLRSTFVARISRKRFIKELNR